MKKIAKLIVSILLACSCFWICSCGDVSNSSSDGTSSTESSVEISNSESDSENTSEDSSSEDSENGGNWTEEMPLN
jgi:hypothetical protein